MLPDRLGCVELERATQARRPSFIAFPAVLCVAVFSLGTSTKLLYVAMLGLVRTGMGDRLWTSEPHWCIVSHPSQLRLLPSSLYTFPRQDISRMFACHGSSTISHSRRFADNLYAYIWIPWNTCAWLLLGIRMAFTRQFRLRTTGGAGVTCRMLLVVSGNVAMMTTWLKCGTSLHSRTTALSSTVSHSFCCFTLVILCDEIMYMGWADFKPTCLTIFPTMDSLPPSDCLHRLWSGQFLLVNLVSVFSSFLIYSQLLALCWKLSWLCVSFAAHIKYFLLYRIVLCHKKIKPTLFILMTLITLNMWENSSTGNLIYFHQIVGTIVMLNILWYWPAVTGIILHLWQFLTLFDWLLFEKRRSI